MIRPTRRTCRAQDPDAAAETYDLFHGQWLLDQTGRAAAPFEFGLGCDVGADHRHRRRRTARAIVR
ncbi:MAG: hypothetical protein R2699_06030 [Acidimicrobiales bacterium]